MAITDDLTQLFNRKHFNSLFENELAKAIRYEKNLSCAIIEIDYFKKIQDKYGHNLTMKFYKIPRKISKTIYELLIS